MKPSRIAWKLLLLIGVMPAAGGVQADEPAFAKGEPSFRRHVIPLLGRAGCSSRECHGSFSGQGGFQLSLFGYDFDADHKELTQDNDGGEGEARVNPADAAKSLLVTKPTAQVKHKGKERFKKDHTPSTLHAQGQLDPPPQKQFPSRVDGQHLQVHRENRPVKEWLSPLNGPISPLQRQILNLDNQPFI